jgi:hypothetical protein
MNLRKNPRPALEFAVYRASDEDWDEYKKTHNKAYSAEEHDEKSVISLVSNFVRKRLFKFRNSRRKNWEQSVAQVNAHNQEAKEGKHTYTQAINQFSDGSRPPTGLVRPKTPVAA